MSSAQTSSRAPILRLAAAALVIAIAITGGGIGAVAASAASPTPSGYVAVAPYTPSAGLAAKLRKTIAAKSRRLEDGATARGAAAYYRYSDGRVAGRIAVKGPRLTAGSAVIVLFGASNAYVAMVQVSVYSDGRGREWENGRLVDSWRDGGGKAAALQRDTSPVAAQCYQQLCWHSIVDPSGPIGVSVPAGKTFHSNAGAAEAYNCGTVAGAYDFSGLLGGITLALGLWFLVDTWTLKQYGEGVYLIDACGWTVS